jgi:translocation and assembly module TamB
MTSRSRFVLRSAAGFLLLLLIIVALGIGTARSPWFYNKIRNRIVSVATDATGGRVEIARFAFDWHTLTATVTGFTLHGTEPAADPPLFHADTVVVGLKIVSLLKRDVDIAFLRVESPKAFLLVAADGTTNIPNPKTPAAKNKTPAQTILDLAIRNFEVNNGIAEVHGTGRSPSIETYSAKGDNLHALFTYDAGTLAGAVPRYHGDISIAPLQVSYGASRSIPLVVTTTVAMEKNRLIVEKSSISSGYSELHLNGKLENFNTPVITAEYGVKISLGEAGSFLALRSRQSGWLEATGSASFKSAGDYAIQAVAKVYNFDYRGGGVSLRNIRAQAKIDGGPTSISIRDLVANALGGQIAGKADIRGFDGFHFDGQVRRMDIGEAAALSSPTALPYDGLASGKVVLEGRFSELNRRRFSATAHLEIVPARKGVPVKGLIDAKYNGARGTLDLGQSFFALPNTRLDFQGTLGQQLSVHFASSSLDDLVPALEWTAKPAPAPVIPVGITPQGQVTFDGTVNGPLASPILAGNLSGSNFILRGQTIDAVRAAVTAAADSVTVSGGTLKQKALNATFSGSARLRNWKPADDLAVNAAVGLENANLADLLAMAGRGDIPVSGTLNATAKVHGTFGNPQAAADLNLTRASAMSEPLNRLTAHLESPTLTRQTLTAQVNAGPNQLNLSATYDHGAADLFPGKLTFQLGSNNLNLTRIVTLHQREPDLAGTVKLTAHGEAGIHKDSAGNLVFALSRIDSSADALGLQEAAKQLGDLHLTAHTVDSSGSAPVVEAQLRSNLADATITGDGRVTLTGDYPSSAKFQFSNVHLDTVRRLLLTPEEAQTVRFAGTVEGSLNLSGPAVKPTQLRGSLDIPKLEIVPLPDTNSPEQPVDLTIRNSAPIRVSIADEIVNVESARIAARDSDFTISGRATIGVRPDLDLHLNGNINLAILHLFDSDLVSSGAIMANAAVRGNVTAPQFSGSLQMKDANLAIADVPNGLSHVNGSVDFNGNQASFRGLTGESGGGKVSVDGFGSFAGGVLSFRVGANATGVRVRYPQGVSTLADAQLTLVGTQQRSTLSGTITIDRLAFNPKTDLGSILSSASAPPETPSGSAGFSSNLQFDVLIQTSPDITFESSYAQSVEADANLRLRGTLASPALLGRVNITQGELNFFGNKYTINQGSVSFFNPVKVEPVLNIDLETIARGVDVTLTVSGPVSKLNVSYRSDPPLQFSEIVALLATGRTPDDATLAAREPTANQQSWQQMGASALVGQAIANPVAARLQRFFGVSNLKIDPSISGPTGSPQAKVTLEQQVTPEITFTYVTDVANAQEQVIRVEWALNQRWSALVLRDENGEVGIEFLYKKRFR